MRCRADASNDWVGSSAARIFLCIAATIAGFGLIQYPAAKAAPASPKVKIGLILPLTGSAASWGVKMRNAAELAMADLGPEQAANLQLVFENDELDSAKALSIFRKLHNVDSVATAIVFGGGGVAAVAPVAEKAQVPIFAITANAGLTKGLQYSFRHWLDADAQVKMLAPALKNQNCRRILAAFTSHEALLNYIDLLDGYGFAVSREEFQPKETDFRAVISRSIAKQPECVVTAFLPPQLSIFMKQLRSSGYKGPAFGFSNTESMSEVEAAGEAVEGMVYTGPALSPDFVERYQKRYGEYPELSAGNVYDIIRMVAQAVASGAVSRQALRDHLAAVKEFKGVLGVYGVSPEQSFTLQGRLKKIQGGKFVELK